MRAPRITCIALPLVLFAAVACEDKGSGSSSAATSSTPSSTPAAASASSPSAPSATDSAAALASARAAAFTAKGQTRHHVGIAGVLLRSAYELSLNDDQRAALDKAEDALYADAATSPWTAVKAFQADLVAGIRAGKLDTTKLQADYGAIDKAVQAGQAREGEALDALHAALDATQRAALAEHVKAWRAAHERSTPAPGADGGAPDLVKRRLERLTRDLGLDDAQQKTVAAALAKDPSTSAAAMQTRREAAQKKVDALLTAFTQDAFEAKKQDYSTGAKNPHEAMERTATFNAAILPTLHPDQREKLAARTERMGSRPGRYFEEVEPATREGGEDEGAGPFRH